MTQTNRPCLRLLARGILKPAIGPLACAITSASLHADLLGEYSSSGGGASFPIEDPVVYLEIRMTDLTTQDVLFVLPITDSSDGMAVSLTEGPAFDAAVGWLTNGADDLLEFTYSAGVPGGGITLSGNESDRWDFFGGAGSNGIDFQGSPIDEIRLVIGAATVTLNSGQLDYSIDYSLQVSFGCGVGANYCAPVANSTGHPGLISASGSTTAADNDLRIRARNLPQDEIGYFLTSQTQGFVMSPGASQGNLCLGGAIGRYSRPSQMRNSGTLGAFELVLDLAMAPQPAGLVAITAGETWNFQAWYRDANRQATSNFTDAISVEFL